MKPYITSELVPFLATDRITTWDLPAIRDHADKTYIPPDMTGVDVTTTTITAPDGDLDLRIITPEDSSGYMYAIHGGGYTAGRAEFDDARNKELALRYSMTVVSPEYRYAPEHPFPAAPRDCTSGLAWTRTQAGDLPVYVYGDSAGAGLAESCVSLGIDDGIAVTGLIMLEPALDPRCSQTSMRTQSDSPIWNAEKARASWLEYLAGQSPDILPRLRDRHDSGLVPPIMVIVNPVDCLRDEGLAWATDLVDHGACVHLHMLPGTFHGFLSAPDTRTWSTVCDLLDRFIKATL